MHLDEALVVARAWCGHASRRMQRSSSSLLTAVAVLIGLQVLLLVAGSLGPGLGSALDSSAIRVAFVAVELWIFLLALADGNDALALLMGVFLAFNLLGLVGNTGTFRPRRSAANSTTRGSTPSTQQRFLAANDVALKVSNLYEIALQDATTPTRERFNISGDSICHEMTAEAQYELTHVFLPPHHAFARECELAFGEAVRKGAFGPRQSDLERIRNSVSLPEVGLSSADYDAGHGVVFHLIREPETDRWFFQSFDGGQFTER